MLNGYEQIDCINIEKVENGFVVTIDGRDIEHDWCNKRRVFTSLNEVIQLLQEAY